mgnify:CR=1 FL=1
MQEHFHAAGQPERFLCPQLPVSPRAAMQLARELCLSVPLDQLVLVGSSLGGFYATALAEDLGCRAVLLNPAITPAHDLARHVGIQQAWHSDQQIDFRPEYIDELAPIERARISRPERYFLVAATGDEVLDWRQMVAHYPGARHKIIEGSDHGLSNFAETIDEVLEFCAR